MVADHYEPNNKGSSHGVGRAGVSAAPKIFVQLSW